MLVRSYASFFAIACLLTACATNEMPGETPDVRSSRLNVPERTPIEREPSPANQQGAVDLDSQPVVDDSIIFREVPSLRDGEPMAVADGPSMPPLRGGALEVTIPPQSVPDFINTVFGEILGTGYSMGPNIAQRQEVVSFRSASSISRAELYSSAANALEDYGISVVYIDGEVRVLQQEDLRRQAPQFIRSRARASVPGNMRPVVQFVELQAMEAGEMREILMAAFPNQQELQIRVNSPTNSLTLTGLPEDVDLALEIVDQMDELEFAGTLSAIVRVDNWEVIELVESLQRILELEGYAVTSQRSMTRAITLFPIEYTQQVAIFARTRDMLDHVINMTRELDQSARSKLDRELRVYKAIHYPADQLATILAGMIENNETLAEQAAGVTEAREQQTANMSLSGGGSGDGAGSDSGPTRIGDFMIDPQGNRIIYRATADQNREFLQLLAAIDTPPEEVLVEVTIAEVTLTDDTSYGMEFLFSQIGSRGYSIGFGTGGGLGLSQGGLSGQYTSGDYVVNFAALASNNQVNVLSHPRIVTKSGAAASIQVGTDVPIVTSQRAANSQNNGTTDVLQTVDYRETGILLDIQPRVLSGDRIDLNITQEVSSAEQNPNQSISSPIISSRFIQTELTLQDGQSAILGGLIENRYTRGTSGVPLIKDVPVLGNLFKTETLSATDTVLMVMITPYILKSRKDRQDVVESYVDYVNGSFETQVDESETLVKPSVPMQIEGQ